MGKVIIVGAGLAGSLLAISLAKKGLEVEVIEKRPDMRKETISAGRSINLALSSRGLNALRIASLESEINAMCIPMNGRMIHPLSGQDFFSSYSGRKGEYINSISRGGLNAILLDEAETYNNVNIQFNAECTEVDLEKATATYKIKHQNQVLAAEGDVIIGTDGAGSAVRKAMMGKTNELMFSYSQQFLTHGYKELSILPLEDGSFRMDKNALHIWPRGSFMIIALPNLDGSFTVTMFHPYDGEYGFNALKDRSQVEKFFKSFYSDLIAYMPDYLDEFFMNPTSHLATIKCHPWQAYGKSILMGDAAHAIVPFYGQGMNASFEDVAVFDRLYDQYDGDWSQIFPHFESDRVVNANAIADLAIDNFYEMRDRVDDQDFIMKRKIEMQLEQTYEDYYSKYSMVTFKPDMPYAEAMKRGRMQDDIILNTLIDNPHVSVEEVYQIIKSTNFNV